MVIEGEGKKLIEQIRVIGKDILQDLMEIDDRLEKLQSRIELSEEIDKQQLLDEINEIRMSIGSIEREDTEEMADEEILENLITKLNHLVDITL